MLRAHFFGRLALAAGLWAALAGMSEAQSRKGGGSGNRGNSSRPSASRSAPAPRSAPKAQSSTKSAAPKVNTAPKVNVAQPSADRNRDGAGKSNVTTGRSPGGRSPAFSNFDRDRDHDGRRYDGRYGYGYGRRHDRDDDDWWRYLAFSAAASLFGVPIGHHSYGAGHYYGAYYPDYYERGYYLPEGPNLLEASPARAPATIEVVLPYPEARVWVQGSETMSQGMTRRYTSPALEAGYDYVYSIKASWEDAGKVTTVERDVSIRPGDRVTIDFTMTPPRISGATLPN
jgi:uncharacterized protein (TIGR03000 family)